MLVFQTAPLAEDLIVAGPVQIELWIDSDAPDTDFTAKLVDVYPPSADYPEGFAMNITDGIRRCRYRDSWEHPKPLAPGERVKVTIEPFATCNLFKKAIACVWTYPAAISRASTSTPIAAKQRARPGTHALLTIACT